MTTSRVLLALGLALALLALGAVAGHGYATRHAAEAAARSETEAARRHAELTARTATLAAQLDAVRVARAEAEARSDAAQAALAEARRARDQATRQARRRHTPAERAVALAELAGTSTRAARALDHAGTPGVWLAADLAAELHLRAARADALVLEVAALERLVDAQRARADAAVLGEGLALGLAEAHRQAWLGAEAARADLARQAGGPWWERPEPWLAVAALAAAGVVAAVAVGD